MDQEVVERARQLDKLRKGREAGLHEVRHAAERLIEFRADFPPKAGVAAAALDAALYKASHGVEKPKPGARLPVLDLTSTVWIDPQDFGRIREMLVWNGSTRVLHIGDEEEEYLTDHPALCGVTCKISVLSLETPHQVCYPCRRVLRERRA